MAKDSNLFRAILRRTVLFRVTWVSTAILLVIFLAVLHLLGWRDDTAFLSGTPTSGNVRAAALRGVVYVLAYFSAVIVSPILIIAAGINALLGRRRKTITNNVDQSQV